MDAMFNGQSWVQRMDNYESVELIIKAAVGVGLVSIPDQPKLRSAPLLQLKVYTDTEMPVSPKNGVALITYEQLSNGFLTLYNEQYLLDGTPWGFKEGISRIPLIELYPWANGTNSYLFNPAYFRGQTIQWDKCYITFPVAQTFAADTAIVIGVQYPSNDYQGSQNNGIPR